VLGSFFDFGFSFSPDFPTHPHPFDFRFGPPPFVVPALPPLFPRFFNETTLLWYSALSLIYMTSDLTSADFLSIRFPLNF